MAADDLPAGDFSSWVAEVRNAISGQQDADVPCDGCTACCASSQFVHIGPDETGTLAHIPAELLFPAPGLPRGHVLLGYDERGHCPMLVGGRCSIYQHRPRTCRAYDCRVFAATGIEPSDDKPLIAQRVRRWRFSFPTEAGRVQHAAIRAAVAYLHEHPDEVPDSVRANPTQQAVTAVEVHDAFLGHDQASGRINVIQPEPAAVRVELTRRSRATIPPPA